MSQIRLWKIEYFFPSASGTQLCVTFYTLLLRFALHRSQLMVLMLCVRCRAQRRDSRTYTLSLDHVWACIFCAWSRGFNIELAVPEIICYFFVFSAKISINCHRLRSLIFFESVLCWSEFRHVPFPGKLSRFRGRPSFSSPKGVPIWLKFSVFDWSDFFWCGWPEYI